MPLYNKKDKEMVKVINIDTKTRTIRVENAADGDIKTWRTTESGTHFPIKKGESTKEALDKFVEKKRSTSTPKTAGQLKKAAAKLESDPAYHYERADRLSEMIKQREKELDSPNITPTAKKAIERGIGDLQLAISKHWDAAGKLEKAQKKTQPAKKDPNEFIKKAAEHNREYEEAKEKLPKEIGQKADQEIHDLNKKYGAIVESMPQGKEKTDKINEWVDKYHAIQDKVIQQTAKKETKSSKFDSRTLDRKLVRGGLSDSEIDDLARMQDYYDISDETINAAIDAGEYSVKEIFKRLRNYDDDFATHLSDFREDYQKATKQPKQSSQPTSYDLDDAFDEADLGSEWGRAKHRMDFHGVSQYTIKDIIDSGKYEAGDIIEALESNSHDKIDEMRKSLKNK